MCKILALAGVKKENDDNVEKLAKTILPYMTAQDNDAVGYAAFKDRLYGERWLNVNNALQVRPTPLLKTLNYNLERKLSAERYNRFGDRHGANHLSSMILHSRFATCGAGLENTHPFVSEDKKTALIHNGVVNTRGLTLKNSTCDSEGILNEYLKHNVSNNPDNIQAIFNKVKGAFACAVLTEDYSGRKYMDLFRNDQYPTLYTCYVKEVDTLVFCTDPAMLENAVQDLGWSMEQMLYVEDNSYLRLDAKTGEVIINREVKKQRASNKKKRKK